MLNKAVSRICDYYKKKYDHNISNSEIKLIYRSNYDDRFVFRVNDNSVLKAVKVIRIWEDDDQLGLKELEKIMRELSLLSQSQSEGIIECYGYEVFKSDGIVLIEMEYGEKTLKDTLNNRKHFSKAEAVSIIMQISTVLINLHKKDIYHRDIKPENIIMCNGKYKVADFGIAVFRKGDEEKTGTGQCTRLYAPPELVFTQKTKSSLVDVYEVGMLLFALLNGDEELFMDSRMAKIPLSKCKSTGDKRLDEIIDKATDYNPYNRYSSLLNMLLDLQGWYKRNVLSDAGSGETQAARNNNNNETRPASVPTSNKQNQRTSTGNGTNNRKSGCGCAVGAILLALVVIVITCVTIAVLSKKGGGTKTTSPTTTIENTTEEESDYIEECDYTEETNRSGEWIDISDESIPVIGGEGVFYNTWNDSYTSIYKNKYDYELSCNNSDNDCNVVDLQNKFKSLTFSLAHEEYYPDDTLIVRVYKGRDDSKQLLKEAKCKPGDKDTAYAVDVSDVSVMTIEYYNPDDFGAAVAVTNGFKLEYK